MLLLGSSKRKSEMCKPILWVCRTAFEVSFLHSFEMLKVPRRQEKKVNMNVLLFSIQKSGMFSKNSCIFITKKMLRDRA